MTHVSPDGADACRRGIQRKPRRLRERDKEIMMVKNPWADDSVAETPTPTDTEFTTSEDVGLDASC